MKIMKIPSYLIVLVALGSVSVASVYAVQTITDTLTVNNPSGNTAISVVSPSGEATILFSDQGPPAQAYRFRLQPSSSGLSIVDVIAGQERFRIGGQGNVGIGTPLPQQKLDVNGNIRLTGNIVSPNDICIGTCP